VILGVDTLEDTQVRVRLRHEKSFKAKTSTPQWEVRTLIVDVLHGLDNPVNRQVELRGITLVIAVVVLEVGTATW
jgi:hypothetical protein